MLKAVIFWPKNTLSFWKSVPDQSWKSFNTKYRYLWKVRESSYHERQILAVFYNLVAAILVKIVLKVLKEPGQVIGKQLFLGKIMVKMFETSFRIHVKWCTTGKVYSGRARGRERVTGVTSQSLQRLKQIVPCLTVARFCVKHFQIQIWCWTQILKNFQCFHKYMSVAAFGHLWRSLCHIKRYTKVSVPYKS